MSEKSEEPQPEQPQTQSTEGAQPQSVEGVEVVELDNGRIAVVGNTYEHRETLKGFGGWWNRRAQRWEFKPAQAQSVREWLAAQQPEPESAQDEPQPEPQPTETHTEPQSHTESETQPQPEPQPEPTNEGEKGVNISSELASAFAKVAAVVAAIVALSTLPQDETTTAKAETGSKIVFSVDDTPELQEVQTDSHTEPTSTTETTAANADRLDALNLARLKAQQLTEENEHTAALFAELEALAACGVDVSDIVRDLHALDDEHRKKGYLTTAEAQIRYYMRQYAQTRARGALSDAEYNTLFRAA
jgi:hypothetical protein